jgi:hypothetical protein
MEALSAEDFEPHIGETFNPLGAAPSLTLAQVLRGAALYGSARSPFTLILHGPPGEVLPEGLHQFVLKDGGTFAFYIMPVHTAAPQRQDYQAVFN